MRVRMTLRRSMVVTALVALGLFLCEEFRDGSPPRFVVRSIPDRIARLRPGMTYEEAEQMLGLEKSWLRGGISGREPMVLMDGCFVFGTYPIGSGPAVTTTAAGTAPSLIAWSPMEIQLSFTTNAAINEDWKRSETTRLYEASFRVDGEVVAEMRK